MKRTPLSYKKAGGLGLIEVMVAMALNIVIVGGVISIYIANTATAKTNAQINDMQDIGRTALMLLNRDIQSAGLTGCGNSSAVGNVLNNSPTAGKNTWWADFNNAIKGYADGLSDPALKDLKNPSPVAGYPSIEVLEASDDYAVIQSHAPDTNQIYLLNSPIQFQPGDVVMACDPNHATIFQINAYDTTSQRVQYTKNGTPVPGNCSPDLGFPSNCTKSKGTYAFSKNSQISRLSASDWFVGKNAAGDLSLYKRFMTSASASQPVFTIQEVARNISNLGVLYLVDGSNSLKATAQMQASDWSKVDAVRISFTLNTKADPVNHIDSLARTFSTTITLRNRVH